MLSCSAKGQVVRWYGFLLKVVAWKFHKLITLHEDVILWVLVVDRRL